jgi:hypothetical protein
MLCVLYWPHSLGPRAGGRTGAGGQSWRLRQEESSGPGGEGRGGRGGRPGLTNPFLNQPANWLNQGTRMARRARRCFHIYQSSFHMSAYGRCMPISVDNECPGTWHVLHILTYARCRLTCLSIMATYPSIRYRIPFPDTNWIWPKPASGMPGGTPGHSLHDPGWQWLLEIARLASQETLMVVFLRWSHHGGAVSATVCSKLPR